MKQQTLAALLKISQGYLSRLEAGQIRPRGDVRLRIERLLGAPEQISLLDQMMLTIRLCPHMSCLIEGGKPFTLLASSAGNRSPRSPFHQCCVDQPVSSPDLVSFMEGVETLTGLREEGTLRGPAGHIWHRQASEGFAPMKSIHIPISTGHKGWMWNIITIALSEPDFAQIEAQWGGRLALDGQASLVASLDHLTRETI